MEVQQCLEVVQEMNIQYQVTCQNLHLMIKNTQKHLISEEAVIFFQNLVHLIKLIQSETVPDMVIFYNGFNEIYSSYQSGTAGQISNYNSIKKRFSHDIDHYDIKLSKKIHDIYKMAIHEKWSHLLNAIVLSKNYFTNFGESPYKEVGNNYGEKESNTLARKIISDYKNSSELLQDLSVMYGFKYFIFWQPCAFYEDYNSDYEKRFIRYKDDKLKNLFISSNDMIKEESISNFFDFSLALSKYKENKYFDICHVNEKANKIISQKIYDIIKDSL